MALSDILQAIGGGLKTGGQDILKGLQAAAPVAGQIAAGGLGALGNAMQAQGNPLAFQAQQQQAMERMREAFQSKQGMTITPYQQAVLDQQKQAHVDLINQQLFENQRQLATGVAGGQFAPESTLDNIIPIPHAKGDIYTLSPDSDIGKEIGLKAPIKVSADKFLDYALNFKGKAEARAEAEAQKQAIKDRLDQAQIQGDQEIDDRFNPDRYQRLYGVSNDPDMANVQKAFHSQLASAVATDKKQGSTTQVDQFFKQLRDYKSDWEKQQLDVRKTKADQLDKRNDQNWQFNSTRLDRERKPLDDYATRFSRLRDSLNSKLPPADALIPAELLTVMAGGQGSGLRVNEAEIMRAMHGQSNWQSVKAALQKWSLDPSKALSITEEQRGYLNDLLNIVGAKIRQKQDIFYEAENGLLNAQNPYARNRAMLKMHHDLEGVDQSNLDSRTLKPIQDIGSPY